MSLADAVQSQLTTRQRLLLLSEMRGVLEAHQNDEEDITAEVQRELEAKEKEVIRKKEEGDISSDDEKDVEYIQKVRHRNGDPLDVDVENKTEDQLGLRWAADEDELAYNRFMDNIRTGSSMWMMEYLEEDDPFVLSRSMEPILEKNVSFFHRRRLSSARANRQAYNPGAFLNTNETNELIRRLVTQTNTSLVVEAIRTPCPHCHLLPTSNPPKFSKLYHGSVSDEDDGDQHEATASRKASVIEVNKEIDKKVQEESRPYTGVTTLSELESLLPPQVRFKDLLGMGNDMWMAVAADVLRGEHVKKGISNTVPEELVAKNAQKLKDQFQEHLASATWKAVMRQLEGWIRMNEQQGASNNIKIRKKLNTAMMEKAAVEEELESARQRLEVYFVGSEQKGGAEVSLASMMEMGEKLEQQETRLVELGKKIFVLEEEKRKARDEFLKARARRKTIVENAQSIVFQFNSLLKQANSKHGREVAEILGSGPELSVYNPLDDMQTIDSVAHGKKLQKVFGEECPNCRELHGVSPFCPMTGSPHNIADFHSDIVTQSTEAITDHTILAELNSISDQATREKARRKTVVELLKREAAKRKQQFVPLFDERKGADLLKEVFRKKKRPRAREQKEEEAGKAVGGNVRSRDLLASLQGTQQLSVLQQAQASSHASGGKPVDSLEATATQVSTIETETSEAQLAATFFIGILRDTMMIDVAHGSAELPTYLKVTSGTEGVAATAKKLRQLLLETAQPAGGILATPSKVNRGVYAGRNLAEKNRALIEEEKHLVAETAHLSEVLRFAHIPVRELLHKSSELEKEHDELVDKVRIAALALNREEEELRRLQQEELTSFSVRPPKVGYSSLSPRSGRLEAKIETAKFFLEHSLGGFAMTK